MFSEHAPRPRMQLHSHALKVTAQSTAASKLKAHSKSSNEKLPQAMTVTERILTTSKPMNSTRKLNTIVPSVNRPGCDIRNLQAAKPLPKPTYASQIATKSKTTLNLHPLRKMEPMKAAGDLLMKSFGKRPNDNSLRASGLATCKSTSVSASRSTFYGNNAAVAAEPQPFSATPRPTNGTQTSFVNISAQLFAQDRRSKSSSVEVAEKTRRLERAIQNLDQLLQQASSFSASFSRPESKLNKNMSEMLLEVDELIQSHNRESQRDIRPLNALSTCAQSFSNLNSESLQQNQKAERRPALSLTKTQSASVFQTSTKPHARTSPLAASPFNTHTGTALARKSGILNAGLDGRSTNVSKRDLPPVSIAVSSVHC
ncbi:hypothetical protein BJ741DRAFT_279980 [Chytriomyces cf. hyalinus JEL632]|nr:hypothetical protein BJ741DRAFT_279980 [Chytriomyces cf. hyalinus JEL632]